MNTNPTITGDPAIWNPALLRADPLPPSREEVWLRAWCAARINVQAGAELAAIAADVCLEQFDKRFPRSQTCE